MRLRLRNPFLLHVIPHSLATSYLTPFHLALKVVKKGTEEKKPSDALSACIRSFVCRDHAFLLCFLLPKSPMYLAERQNHVEEMMLDLHGPDISANQRHDDTRFQEKEFAQIKWARTNLTKLQMRKDFLLFCT